MTRFSEVLARVIATRGGIVDIDSCRTCGAPCGLECLERDDTDAWRVHVLPSGRIVATCPPCSLLVDALADLAASSG